jgi:O-antigen ligase
MAARATISLGRQARAHLAADRRVMAWIIVAAAAGVAGIGEAGGSKAVFLAGALVVGGMVAVLAPQLLLALYLVAGGLKSAPYLSGIPVDLTLLTAGCVILAVLARALKPDGIPPFQPATFLAIGLAALVVLGVLWSPAPDLALDKALRFETFTMVAFFAPLVLLRTPAELKRLAIFVVLFSLLIALTAVPGKAPNQPLTIAGGESEIELALYASAGLVAAAGYLALTRGSRWRILWLIPAAVLAKTVLAAGSRGVLLGVAAALLLIGIQAIARTRAKGAPIVVMVVAIATVGLFGGQIAGPAAVQKYQGLLFSSDTSTDLGKRNYLLDEGVALALAHPMGLGTSGYEAKTHEAYPHNAFAEVAAEQGIIGLGLLAGLIGASLWATRKARDGPLSPESIFAGGLLLVVVADAMVSQTFTQFRELWFAMGLAIAVRGIGWGDKAPGRGRLPLSRMPRSASPRAPAAI